MDGQQNKLELSPQIVAKYSGIDKRTVLKFFQKKEIQIGKQQKIVQAILKISQDQKSLSNILKEA